MLFKMVPFNIKMQNLELVNLKFKCVTYAQPTILPLKLFFSCQSYIEWNVHFDRPHTLKYFISLQ